MQINLNSVFVDNQDKALKFYTEVLEFIKKADVPVGEFKWLTVVSPENPDGVELLLEPNANPASKIYQQALHEQGIPATSFAVADIQSEYERLKRLGVTFTMEPTRMGPVTVAVLDDTCGNFIQIAQMDKPDDSGSGSIGKLSRKETAVTFLRMIVEGKIREAYAAFTAPGLRHHNPYFKGDAEALIVAMEEDQVRSPKKTIETVHALEDGNIVAVHSHLTMAPGGKDFATVHCCRFEGDRIVELWDIAQAQPDNMPNENGMF